MITYFSLIRQWKYFNSFFFLPSLFSFLPPSLFPFILPPLFLFPLPCSPLLLLILLLLLPFLFLLLSLLFFLLLLLLHLLFLPVPLPSSSSSYYYFFFLNLWEVSGWISPFGVRGQEAGSESLSNWLLVSSSPRGWAGSQPCQPIVWSFTKLSLLPCWRNLFILRSKIKIRKVCCSFIFTRLVQMR